MRSLSAVRVVEFFLFICNIFLLYHCHSVICVCCCVGVRLKYIRAEHACVSAILMQDNLNRNLFCSA